MLHVQSVCSSLASIELEFDVHVWHTSDVAPCTVQYFPATQLVQSSADFNPVAIEYFPAPQYKHVSFEDAADVFEYFPMEQSVQVKFPIDILYFPAGHSEQVLLVVSVQPALHSKHGPPGASAPSGHCMQTPVPDVVL